jgi:hypothetical protein
MPEPISIMSGIWLLIKGALVFLRSHLLRHLLSMVVSLATWLLMSMLLTSASSKFVNNHLERIIMEQQSVLSEEGQRLSGVQSATTDILGAGGFVQSYSPPLRYLIRCCNLSMFAHLLTVYWPIMIGCVSGKIMLRMASLFRAGAGVSAPAPAAGGSG